MRLIGDVHARFDEYTRLIADCDASIQVGDFGVGFGIVPDAVPTHRFIRGNHDNPDLCYQHPRWIADGTMHEGIFCFGGAQSIDKHMRIPGVDWWPDEEVAPYKLPRAIQAYADIRPNVVVTHDGPDSIVRKLFTSFYAERSRTRLVFDMLLSVHVPKLWVFGHWHQSARCTVKDCDFVCLAELETFDLTREK